MGFERISDFQYQSIEEFVLALLACLEISTATEIVSVFKSSRKSGDLLKLQIM